LLRQKKVAKEKATPVRRPFGVPCVARLVRRLWNSRYALRQFSPTTPDQPVLLGGAQGRESQKRFCVRVAHDCFVGFGEAGFARLTGFGVLFLNFIPCASAE
jgi:hypothetical protein